MSVVTPTDLCTKEEYTLYQGNTTAASDAKHDFGGVPLDILSLINPNLPKPATRDNFLSENQFLSGVMGISEEQLNNNVKLPTKDIDPTRIVIEEGKNYGRPNVEFPDTFNYEAFSYIEEDFDTTTISFIKRILNDKGITEDVFIICDVAYSNVRKDLCNVNKTGQPNQGQTFYWTQTLETQFDPAGKTAWHTGREYGFHDGASKFQFCWEACLPSNKPSRLFPMWKGGDDEKISKSIYPPQQMITVNKNIYMSTNVKDNDYYNYKNHQTILIRNNGSSVSYGTSQLASKAEKVFSGAEKASYISFGKKIIQGINGLLGNIQHSVVSEFTDEFHVLSKKFGDAGQALFSCETGRMMHKYKDPSVGGSAHDNIKPFMSNKNNMFVSYDKIAVGSALAYNSPLVLFNQHDGGILFIRKDLMDINDILPNTIKKFKGIFSEPKISELNHLISVIRTHISVFNGKKERIIELCSAYKFKDDKYFPPYYTKEQENDIIKEMQQYFKNVFACLIPIGLIQGIHISPDNLNAYLTGKKDELTKTLTSFNMTISSFNMTISIEGNLIVIRNFPDGAFFEQVTNSVVTIKKEVNELLNSAIAIFSNMETYIKTTSDKLEIIINHNLKLGEIDTALPKKMKKNIESFNPIKFSQNSFKPSVLFIRSSEIFTIETVIRPIWDVIKNETTLGLQEGVRNNIANIILIIENIIKLKSYQVNVNIISRLLRPSLVKFENVINVGKDTISTMLGIKYEPEGGLHVAMDGGAPIVAIKRQLGKDERRYKPYNDKPLKPKQGYGVYGYPDYNWHLKPYDEHVLKFPTINVTNEHYYSSADILFIDSFLRIILSMILFVGKTYRDYILDHANIQTLIYWLLPGDDSEEADGDGEEPDGEREVPDVDSEMSDENVQDDFYFNALLSQLENFNYTFYYRDDSGGEFVTSLTQFKSWIDKLIEYDLILIKNGDISNGDISPENIQIIKSDKSYIISFIEKFKNNCIIKCINKITEYIQAVEQQQAVEQRQRQTVEQQQEYLLRQNSGVPSLSDNYVAISEPFIHDPYDAQPHDAKTHDDKSNRKRKLGTTSPQHPDDSMVPIGWGGKKSKKHNKKTIKKKIRKGKKYTRRKKQGKKVKYTTRKKKNKKKRKHTRVNHKHIK